MAKTKKKQTTELDGVFIFKLVLYVLFGSLWLKLHRNGATTSVPLPIGLIIGFLFTSHEHFQIDRKIEYAVLIIAALIGLIVPYGLFMTY